MPSHIFPVALIIAWLVHFSLLMHQELRNPTYSFHRNIRIYIGCFKRNPRSTVTLFFYCLACTYLIFWALHVPGFIITAFLR